VAPSLLLYAFNSFGNTCPIYISTDIFIVMNKATVSNHQV
jgi:hypothetical protein